VIVSLVGEVLVDRLGDHVVLVAIRAELAAGVGREPDRAGGPADGQVAQPQRGKGEAGQIPAVRKTEPRAGAAHAREQPGVPPGH
jgi:hypothetical protein